VKARSSALLALSVPILNDKNTAKSGGTMANDHLRFMAHLLLGFFGWDHNGSEKIMRGSERISLAAAFLVAGTTFAIAQNGQATGGYPSGAKNPSLYGGYYGDYGYYAPPRRYGLGPPYWVLGYPVPHYGYRPWRRWWW
jgi:hypothetical protein